MNEEQTESRLRSALRRWQGEDETTSDDDSERRLEIVLSDAAGAKDVSIGKVLRREVADGEARQHDVGAARHARV